MIRHQPVIVNGITYRVPENVPEIAEFVGADAARAIMGERAPEVFVPLHDGRNLKVESVPAEKPADPKHFHTFTGSLPSEPFGRSPFQISEKARKQLVDAMNRALGKPAAPAAQSDPEYDAAVRARAARKSGFARGGIFGAPKPAELTPAQKAGHTLSRANAKASERQSDGLVNSYRRHGGEP